MQNLKFAIRMLLKNPGLTAAVALTLALGIGANTAIFSVVNSLLLRPLPFDDAERLVVLWAKDRPSDKNLSVSYPDCRDWQAQSESFEDIAAVAEEKFTLTGTITAERIPGEWVSPNYFSALGVRPVMGRVFLPEENLSPDAHPVAMLSYGFWQRNFGADPAVLEKFVRLNDQNLTVVGILPEGFKGISGKADVWVPMMMFNSLNPAIARFDIINDRGTHWHQAVGRLKSGVGLEQARAEMEAIATRLAQAYPKTNRDHGVTVIPMREELVGNLQPVLLVLFGAVGFLLMIACANVANLLLARAASRQKEMAIRAALGAGRGRLLSQLLTESILLSTLGGITGLLVAYWSIDFLVSLNPFRIPDFLKIDLDLRVLIFTLAVSLVAGLIFGLTPALGALRINLNEWLKDGARSQSNVKSRRTRNLLVVAEMALSLMLLVGAGLMLRSFQQMLRFDTGFKTDRLLTATILPPIAKYPEPAQTALRERIIERVAALPEVEAAGLSSHTFYGSGYLSGFVTVETRSASDSSIPVYQQYVSPGFFQALSLAQVAGRDFTAQDIKQATSAVIISQSIAQKYWPDENPIGKRIKRGQADSKNPWMEIVGVVSDAKPRIRLTEKNNLPFVYFPMTEASGWASSPVLYIRARTETATIASTLREAIREIDPDIPIYNIATVEELLAVQFSDTRFIALLMGVFSLLSLALAAVGVYGVVSYTVSQRTQEIGIRVAIGARSVDILNLVLGQSMVLIVAGITVGLALAFALTRFMSSLLFGVSATDPITFFAVAALLAGIGLFACLMPARRAVKVDPITTLRHE